METLGLLGMYFDAGVVFVIKFSTFIQIGSVVVVMSNLITGIKI